jgi:hypothetical protein
MNAKTCPSTSNFEFDKRLTILNEIPLRVLKYKRVIPYKRYREENTYKEQRETSLFHTILLI